VLLKKFSNKGRLKYVCFLVFFYKFSQQCGGDFIHNFREMPFLSLQN